MTMKVSDKDVQITKRLYDIEGLEREEMVALKDALEYARGEDMQANTAILSKLIAGIKEGLETKRDADYWGR
jgi:hypothetical protein